MKCPFQYPRLVTPIRLMALRAPPIIQKIAGATLMKKPRLRKI